MNDELLSEEIKLLMVCILGGIIESDHELIGSILC